MYIFNCKLYCNYIVWYLSNNKYVFRPKNNNCKTTSVAVMTIFNQ